MSAPARLDNSVIGMLETMSQDGASDFLTTIISVYLESATGLLDRLVRGGTNGDADAVARASHDLKSASATLGATRLASLCAELESLVRAGRTGHLETLVRDIAAEFSAVRPELEALAYVPAPLLSGMAAMV
jgi:HPt (histidine-containing phosphotransfer) domain-containing protein